MSVADVTPDSTGTAAATPGRPRRSGLRRVSAGLSDQVVIATANAANTVLALVLLSFAAAGTMLLSLSLAYLVIGINRAFVGDVLLAQASRLDGAHRDRLVRNGLAAALSVGIVSAIVLTAVGVSWPHSDGNIDLRDLVWVAPFLPVLLVHDTGRYAYLAARTPVGALVIDLIWVGTQAIVIVLMLASGRTSAAGLLVAWGVGASAGACVYLLRSGARPWRGDPRRWVAETRELSGWFTATAIVAQVQVQAVGFLVAGPLGSAELAALRGAQTVLLQPVQNLVTAVMGLLVPRSARLAAAVGVAPVAALRRQTNQLTAAFAALAVLMVAIVVPVAHEVLTRFDKYASLAPLALPVSIQAGIYLLQIPYSAAMRGMHQARSLFAQYVFFSITSLTGLLVGAYLDRLSGAAWGLTTGATVGFAVMVVFYQWALRDLGLQAGVSPPDETG